MQNGSSYGNVFFTMVKGVGTALGCSLLSTVILACLLRFGALPDKAIYPVNQVLKVVFVSLSAILFVRGEKGWLQGGGIGLLFTALAYVTFSAIGGNFSLSWLALVELALAFFAGALGGVIGVNLRR